MKFAFSAFAGVIYWLTLFAWCLVPGVAAAKPVQLELRSVVQVKSAAVVLADVVNVDAATRTDEAQLLAMPIGTMSQSGASMLVERKSLEKWVRQHAGMHGREIRWVGAGAVNIMLQMQLVDALQIRGFARAILEEWVRLNAGGSNIEIRDQGELKSLAVPTGEVKMRVSRLSEPLSMRKKLTVLLDVLVSDHLVKTVPVLFETSGSRQALLVRHEIARGGAVTEADVEMKEVDIFADMNELISQADFARTTLRAKTVLRKGAILSRANLEAMPDVARGDFAVLLAHEGLVSIESRVEAMQDGYVGQIIRVRPGNSNNQIPAKIIEPGKVELR